MLSANPQQGLEAAAQMPWLIQIDDLEQSDQDRYREVWLHEARVAWLCAGLAREIGCSNAGCLEMFRAGRFHDVGKLEMPHEVLFKPCALTADEKLAIEGHTRRGAEILLRGGDPVPRGIIDAVLHHHERYDGSGYAGLRGEALPFSARMVALADVYDALRTSRSYKRAMAEGDTLSLMTRPERGFGRHIFDPVLLRSFVRMRLRLTRMAIPDTQRAALADFAASDPQQDVPADALVTFHPGYRILWAEVRGKRGPAAAVLSNGDIRDIPGGYGIGAAGAAWALPAAHDRQVRATCTVEPAASAA